MQFRKGSRHLGTLLAVAASMLAFSTFENIAAAATVFTVNGTPVDDAVIDIYFANRLGENAAAPTPQQRTALIAELRDIYLLATQEVARELAKDPQLAARIELQKQSVLAQAVAQDFMSTITVSDEEIRAEYDEQVKLAPPLQFKARHILVASKEEADSLVSQLNNGADFEDLARENSTGPSAPSGGDLGWFSPDQMVAPFSNAVAALEDGSYTSEPVQTRFGWHVILREESRENQPPTFESVRDVITQRVQQKKFQLHLETLRAASTE